MENDIENLFQQTINIDEIGKYDKFINFDENSTFEETGLTCFKSNILEKDKLTQKEKLNSLNKMKIYLEIAKNEEIEKTINLINSEYAEKFENLEFSITKLKAIIFLKEKCNFTIKLHSLEESSTSSDSSPHIP